MTNTRTARTDAARRITDADRKVAMYRELLTVARRFEDEPEVDFQLRQLAEWEQEQDDAIEAAAELGFTPDELFDAAATTGRTTPRS